MKEYEAMPEKGDPADLPEVRRTMYSACSIQFFECCSNMFNMLLCRDSCTDAHWSDG